MGFEPVTTGAWECNNKSNMVQHICMQLLAPGHSTSWLYKACRDLAAHALQLATQTSQLATPLQNMEKEMLF